MRKTLLPLLLAFASCQEAEKEVRYFDLPDFFQNEVTRLESTNLGVTKIITKGEQMETLHSDSVQWKEELGPFLSVDLNKPAFNKKFFVDTLMGEGKDYSLVFSAVDSGMQVQYAQVDIDSAGKVVQLSLRTWSQNDLYASMQHLFYRPMDSYSVERMEMVEPGEARRYAVYGRFVRPEKGQ